MRPKSDKLSWDEDGKTAEAPSSYSQQRIKAVKPRISWEDDACTVARPADAKLPEDAFRPDLVEVSEGTDSVELSEAIDAVAVGEESRPVEVGNASAPSETQAREQVAELAASRAQPHPVPHPWRRWILLAATIPVFYALSYAAVRVVQKLQQPPAGPARIGAPASQLWGAVREVLQEAVDQLSSTPRR